MSAVIPKNTITNVEISFHFVIEIDFDCPDSVSGTKINVKLLFFFRSRTFSADIGNSYTQSSIKIVHNITKIPKNVNGIDLSESKNPRGFEIHEGTVSFVQYVLFPDTLKR